MLLQQAPDVTSRRPARQAKLFTTLRCGPQTVAANVHSLHRLVTCHLHMRVIESTCVSVESSPLQPLCGAGGCCSPVKRLGGWCRAAVVVNVPQHQLATLEGGGQADDQRAKVV
jgi:hypothetical protein